MTVYISPEFCLKKGDKISLGYNKEQFDGEIVNAGEGSFDSVEPEFMMFAPSLIDDPFENDTVEIETSYIIAKIFSKRISFSHLPVDAVVEVKTEVNPGEKVPVTITAIIGSSLPSHYYLCAAIRQ